MVQSFEAKDDVYERSGRIAACLACCNEVYSDCHLREDKSPLLNFADTRFQTFGIVPGSLFA